MDRPWGRKESDTMEQLTHTHNIARIMLMSHSSGRCPHSPENSTKWELKLLSTPILIPHPWSLTPWKSLCWSRRFLFPVAGKDWRQEEKGMTEDEMVGWHHWLNGHDVEQTPEAGYGQGSLACCSPWGLRVRHNWVAELNWTGRYHSHGVRDPHLVSHLRGFPTTDSWFRVLENILEGQGEHYS